MSIISSDGHGQKPMSLVSIDQPGQPATIPSITMEDLTGEREGIKLDFERTGLNNTTIERLADVLGNLQISMRNVPGKPLTKVDGNLLLKELRAKIKAYEEALFTGPVITALDEAVARLIKEFCDEANNRVPTGITIPKGNAGYSGFGGPGSNETTASMEIARQNRKYDGVVRLPTYNGTYTLHDLDDKADMFTFNVAYNHTFLTVLSMRLEPWRHEGRFSVLKEILEEQFSHMRWETWVEFCKAMTLKSLQIFFRAIFVYAKLNVSEELEYLRSEGLHPKLRKLYLKEMLNDRSHMKLICETFTDKYMRDMKAELKKMKVGSSSMEQVALGITDAVDAVKRGQPFSRALIMKTYAAALNLLGHNASDIGDRVFETFKGEFLEYLNYTPPEAHFERTEIGLLAVIETAYRLYLTDDGLVTKDPSQHIFDFNLKEGETETVAATRSRSYLSNILALRENQWLSVWNNAHEMKDSNMTLIAVRQYNAIKSVADEMGISFKEAMRKFQ